MSEKKNMLPPISLLSKCAIVLQDVGWHPRGSVSMQVSDARDEMAWQPSRLVTHVMLLWLPMGLPHCPGAAWPAV
jgi:hypothetical protein